MNTFVDFFLKIRNSKAFSGIVIAVIVASAIYAGVSSYNISPEYTVYLDLFDYAITSVSYTHLTLPTIYSV